MKNYKTWLACTIAFQLLTAFFHSLSFISDAQPNNEQEKQLYDLMISYHFETPGGFSPTYANLFTSMSICFVLLCLLSASSHWFFLKTKAPLRVLKGFGLINTLLFGGCFLTMLFLTFLPPVICTGLILLSLILAQITFPKN